MTAKYYIRFFLAAILWGVSAGAILATRFENIDMTDMRLFVTYWWQLLVFVTGLVTGYIYMTKKGTK